MTPWWNRWWLYLCAEMELKFAKPYRNPSGNFRFIDWDIHARVRSWEQHGNAPFYFIVSSSILGYYISKLKSRKVLFINNTWSANWAVTIFDIFPKMYDLMKLPFLVTHVVWANWTLLNINILKKILLSSSSPFLIVNLIIIKPKRRY